MSRAVAFIYREAEVLRVQSAFKAQCRRWLQSRNEWLELADALTATANDVVNESIQSMYVDPHANEYVGNNRVIYKELCVAHERKREVHLQKCRAVLNQMVKKLFIVCFGGVEEIQRKQNHKHKLIINRSVLRHK